MKIKTTLLIIVLLICFLPSISAKKYYLGMAESEMKRNPESWMIDFSKKLKWDYCNGLELQAFLRVWEKTGNERYFQYVKSYADTIVDAKGQIYSYKPEEYSLDKINSGKIFFTLYERTKDEKYRKAIELLRNQINAHPRTSEGGFWHKKIYPHQMWLDGIYMASPFLAEYGYRFKEPALFDEVASQILLIAKHCYDPVTGLYYHGWDESRQQKWADPIKGTSPNFWSRSMGWYTMAIVDVLDYLPANHPRRPEIIKVLTDLCYSLDKYRDPKTGMWFQVTDKINQKGNYVESSGSAMFIYTWVKGAQKGYLPKEFLKKGENAYKQFVRTFIVKNSDGTLTLKNACAVAGLGGEKNYRDGSYEYYISEPIRDNDPKAVAPFMMVSVLLNK